MKVQYIRSLLLNFLQAVRTLQKNFGWFQISLLWQPKSKQWSIIERKVYSLSKNVLQNNLEPCSLIMFLTKSMTDFSSFEKTIVFCF